MWKVIKVLSTSNDNNDTRGMTIVLQTFMYTGTKTCVVSEIIAKDG